jgi:hypothetical protein
LESEDDRAGVYFAHGLDHLLIERHPGRYADEGGGLGIATISARRWDSAASLGGHSFAKPLCGRGTWA